MDQNEIDGEISIADLYPDLSPEEQANGEYRLLGYIAIVKWIWDRFDSEGRLDELRSLLLTEQWKKKQ